MKTPFFFLAILLFAALNSYAALYQIDDGYFGGLSLFDNDVLEMTGGGGMI